MATAAAPPPILDFTTERERLTVKIDGVTYEMRDEADLTLSNYRLLNQAGPRLSALEDAPQMSKAQEAEYAQLLKEICLLALDAPASVVERTGVVQRIAIVRSFCELSAPSLRRMGETMQARIARTATPSPGTSSSRGSNGSTAARTRRSGSRRSR